LYLSGFISIGDNAFNKKIDKKMNYLMLLAVIFASHAENSLQNTGADTSYLLYCGGSNSLIPRLQLC
jgi:ABC-type polysaccharide/polyol phosphate transport system ATPase subunit